MVRKVLESPFATDARLDVAAWLEANDDPDRAELIRLQIERAHLPFCDCTWDESDLTQHAPNCPCQAVWKRSIELERRIRREQTERWTGYLQSWAVGGAAVLQGGFFSMTIMSLDWLRRYARRLFSEHPIVCLYISDRFLLPRSDKWTLQLGTPDEPEDQRERCWLPYSVWAPSRDLLTRIEWTTKSAGYFFLSLLCVNFGRHEAGLPILAPGDIPDQTDDQAFQLPFFEDGAEEAFAVRVRGTRRN
jgi:uncharacterized protein (TIGR02996 family)